MSKGIVVSVATKAADKPAVRSLVGGVVVASAGAGLFAVRLADVVAGVLVGFGAVLIVGGKVTSLIKIASSVKYFDAILFLVNSSISSSIASLFVEYNSSGK